MNKTDDVPALREGMIIPVTVLDIAFGGDGVARHQNQVIFIPHAAPGDEVAVEIGAIKKRHARGTIREIVRPSPLRIAPRCPHFTRCGGCDYQHLSYPDQLAIKKTQVREIFRRLGSFPDPPVADAIPSPRPFHYRGKADFRVRKRPGRDGRAGFLRRESNTVVDIERCEIVTESLNQALAGLRRKLDEYPGTVPGQQVTAWSWGREIGADVPAAALDDPVLKEALHGRPLAADLFHSPGRGRSRDFPEPWPVHAGTAGGLASCGDVVPRVVKDRGFLVPARGFFQANVYLTGRLVDTVVAMCALTGREAVLDAYCGSGLFSMFLAPLARRIFGIELSGEAVSCARENLTRAGRENTSFLDGDIAEIVGRDFAASRPPLDILVLDPPREGCRDLLAYIPAWKPKRIVYVSCHPATQARDCRYFADHGYALQTLQPLDMFPQTGHIEVVALLTLREK